MTRAALGGSQVTSSDEKAAWAEVERAAGLLVGLLGGDAGADAARQAGQRLVRALCAYRLAISPRRPKEG